MAASRGTLAEEAPEAYKDVSEVVDVVQHTRGLSPQSGEVTAVGSDQRMMAS